MPRMRSSRTNECLVKKSLPIGRLNLLSAALLWRRGDDSGLMGRVKRDKYNHPDV
jgi:hypothetical protein